MNRLLKLTISMLCVSFLTLTVPVSAVQIQTEKGAKSNNYGANDMRWYWADVLRSNLFVNSDGTYTRIEDTGKANIIRENYSSDYKLLSSGSIKKEGAIFGGAYSGTSSNYMVFGNLNRDESPDVDCFVIVKYSKNWEKISYCTLKDCNTTVPFRAGSLRFAEYGNKLYIRTCHEMYKSYDGFNHQANVMIEVDTDSMQVMSSFTDVAWADVGYVSHSFNQFLQIDGNRLIALDHGDAYPRALVLSKYDDELGADALRYSVDSLNVFKFPGEIGENYTGCGVGGFEISSSNYLVAGKYENNGEVKNVFVNVTPKTYGENSSSMKYITGYTANSSIRVSTPHMVKINDNRFMLIWEEDNYASNSSRHTVNYCLIDGSGNKVSDKQSMRGMLSDCAPKVIGNKIVWYYTYDGAPIFCEIPIDGSRTPNDNGIRGIDQYELIIDGKSVDCVVFGDECTIMAEDKKDKTFKKWEVVSGKPQIKDVYSSSTVLVMPGENVELKSTYNVTSKPSLGKGNTLAAAEKIIRGINNDKDPAGSQYGILQLRSVKQGKNNIALSWKKVKNAETYVVYGNVCGKDNKMKKLKALKKNSLNIKKISGKLKKGKYHKFIVVCLDKNNKVLSVSKIVHVATKGGKAANPTKVTVKKPTVLKKGKTFKLKAKQIGKKVKKHRPLCYESSDPKVATVSKKGVIKAVGKGKCYIYAYAQNGVFKKVAVTVSSK